MEGGETMRLGILYAGPMSTVQDAGRFGYRRFGVPVSGAADEDAYRLANLLVGNAGDEAVIESTLAGPTVEFFGDCVVCATGAQFAPHLNGARIDMYRAIRCRAGDVLEMGAATAGCRGYLAVMGGIDVPMVMGSRATYARAGLGGYEGRVLKDGDELPIGAHGTVPRGISLWHIRPPVYDTCVTLRAIRGPQDHLFKQEGIEAFFGTEFLVDTRADRMGARLVGATVSHLGDGNIISDGVSAGAVQVPGDGRPIVMLADAQTTGGYAKIAHVAAVDLPRAAQLRPGDRIRFSSIGVEEAQTAYRARLAKYDAWEQRLQMISNGAKEYDVRIEGAVHRVAIAPDDVFL